MYLTDVRSMLVQYHCINVGGNCITNFDTQVKFVLLQIGTLLADGSANTNLTSKSCFMGIPNEKYSLTSIIQY